MNIPNVVRIGGVDYEIEYSENLRIGNSIAYGKIDYDDCVIELSSSDGTSHNKRCQIFWHEVIHGVVDHANLELPSDDEEHIIDTIAKGINQVIQDNEKNLFIIKEKKK